MFSFGCSRVQSAQWFKDVAKTQKAVYNASKGLKFYVYWLSKRLESFINSCTVKNIYVLNDWENEKCPNRRESQFWDKMGKTFIVTALSLSYVGQCKR